jgi:hypothetical protein
MPGMVRSSLGVAAAALVIGAAAGILTRFLRQPSPEQQLPRHPETGAAKSVIPVVAPPAAKTTAVSLNRASALLAVSALADMAMEHYRGEFHNPVMMVPLAVGTQAAAINLHGAFTSLRPYHAGRDVGQGIAVATGVTGLAFHFYNILKRPGGWSWHNLFYAAPLGAPMALSLVGLFGGLAERLRRGTGNITGLGNVAGLPLAPLVTGLVVTGLLGTSAEAALLHFRGAYQNPAMYIPVTLPPVAAGLLAAAYMSRGWRRPARWSLRALIAVGLLGAGFHAYGIQRAMGGWRNWSQNLLSGPPLPAPPAFTALAIAGLGALDLLEQVA